VPSAASGCGLSGVIGGLVIVELPLSVLRH
jgi:hypothetical protein